MRIIVLTSSLRGFGAFCLPALAHVDDLEIPMIVYSEGTKSNRWKYVKRKLEKTKQIGPLGALNGIRIRRWFKDDVRDRLEIQDLRKAAEDNGVRVEVTPRINCDRTRELFREADADLGLSLGNSYISRDVFTIPKFGMLNVHHEVLPDYQGAQSVIWQIYNGSRETGYTIHEINRKIDAGRILLRETFPIEFQDRLSETVTHNYSLLYRRSVNGLIEVIRNYSDFRDRAESQKTTRYYTTPSFWQYLRMVRNHKKLAAEERELSRV